MTETTETTATDETVIDVGPGNVTPDRALRHRIRNTLRVACGALAGEPGLTPEQQVGRVERALMAAETAVAELTTLKTLLVNRDFEKFQATRDRSAEAPDDGPAPDGLVGVLIMALGGNPVDDDDDESSSDLTQD